MRLREAIKAAAKGVPSVSLVCAMQRMCEADDVLWVDPGDVRAMGSIADSLQPAIVQVMSLGGRWWGCIGGVRVCMCVCVCMITVGQYNV